MALQTSGPISLNDIHIEAGGTTGTLASLNDTDIRDLISKGSGATMSFNEWYGASAFSETRTITIGTASTPGSGHSGYFTWDVAQYIGTGPRGSINNSSLVDANGTSRTIEGYFRTGASGYDGLTLSLGGTSTSGFTKLIATLNGTVYQFTRAVATSTTGSNPTRVTWRWDTSNNGFIGQPPSLINDLRAELTSSRNGQQSSFTLE